MICDNCLNPTVRYGWHNNQRLCSKCLHYRMPKKQQPVQEDKPTIKDLMKKWNRN